MIQITLNIEDKSILPHLKKVLSALKGVSIAKKESQHKPGIEKALEDVENGRVKRFDSVEALFEDLGI